MARRLRRRLDAGALEPGEFRIEGGVRLACPSCGHVQALPDTHTVLRGGNVDLIWVCASESCPASTWLELTDAFEEVLR